jgi:DNA-binding CsgD family transcriptional regulator
VGQIALAAIALGDRKVAEECNHLLLPTAAWCGGDGGGAPFAIGSGEYYLGRLALTPGDRQRLDMPGPLTRALALSDRPTDWPAPATHPATARPGGLIEREYEVARLVGQALTNQQIAERLFLSVRTVESHVRNALTKLGLQAGPRSPSGCATVGAAPRR